MLAKDNLYPFKSAMSLEFATTCILRWVDFSTLEPDLSSKVKTCLKCAFELDDLCEQHRGRSPGPSMTPATERPGGLRLQVHICRYSKYRYHERTMNKNKY